MPWKCCAARRTISVDLRANQSVRNRDTSRTFVRRFPVEADEALVSSGSRSCGENPGKFLDRRRSCPVTFPFGQFACQRGTAGSGECPRLVQGVSSICCTDGYDSRGALFHKLFNIFVENFCALFQAPKALWTFWRTKAPDDFFNAAKLLIRQSEWRMTFAATTFARRGHLSFDNLTMSCQPLRRCDRPTAFDRKGKTFPVRRQAAAARSRVVILTVCLTNARVTLTWNA